MSVVQYKLNLPEDINRWIEKASVKSLRSKSAEIIFILREKMESHEKEKGEAPA
jgi:hypothetical protein